MRSLDVHGPVSLSPSRYRVKPETGYRREHPLEMARALLPVARVSAESVGIVGG